MLLCFTYLLIWQLPKLIEQKFSEKEKWQFDLENELGEPLTGRDITVKLFPLSQMEFNKNENLVETKSRLEERLILGSYPELLQYEGWDKKSMYLDRLVGSYLIRDILSFERLKKPDKIISLLRLIAFQIGQEVSLPELGKQLGIDKKTVERYLDLLTKVFVLYKAVLPRVEEFR